ncbi:MAG: glycosyltransferase [Limnoraphis sp. WC205]|jgi:glycosyltransferase involved in cell wall biosynthesis|nr:glycosyltransferase [Limnoraphis sp. WC205]
MKTTCLINNYNYGKFIVESVKSVLSQTVSFDEIIIVDDCSTDDSVEIIKNNFSDSPEIKLVLKKQNEGQLSAFNEGYLASTGDLIFFLDSDDIYQPTYLEETLNFYQKHPDCDFLFCSHEKFGTVEGISLPYETDRDLGYAIILTLYNPQWKGVITSAISMKRKILNRFLPIPYLEDWRRRADDCLIWGASLVGAKRFYMAKPLVKYRMHGSNFMLTYQANISTVYQRFVSLNYMFEDIRQKMNYGSELYQLAHLEFRTIPCPTTQEFVLYFKLIMSFSIPFYKKLGMLKPVFQHFLKNGKFRSR